MAHLFLINLFSLLASLLIGFIFLVLLAFLACLTLVRCLVCFILDIFLRSGAAEHCFALETVLSFLGPEAHLHFKESLLFLGFLLKTILCSFMNSLALTLNTLHDSTFFSACRFHFYYSPTIAIFIIHVCDFFFWREHRCLLFIHTFLV